jgi:hypothetical protein
MTPQEIVENIMREMPSKILLGFDLRKLVAQCVELGYIAGCERSATIVKELDDGEYNWQTYIIDDYKRLLGIK